MCVFVHLEGVEALLQAGGVDPKGPRPAVRDEPFLPKLGEERRYLLSGGPDAAGHLFVRGASPAHDAAVGLRLALPGEAHEEQHEASSHRGEGEFGHLLLERADPEAEELQQREGAVARRSEPEELGDAEVHQGSVLDHDGPFAPLPVLAEAELAEEFPRAVHAGDELPTFGGEEAGPHSPFPYEKEAVNRVAEVVQDPAGLVRDGWACERKMLSPALDDVHQRLALAMGDEESRGVVGHGRHLVPPRAGPEAPRPQCSPYPVVTRPRAGFLRVGSPGCKGR